MLVLLLIWILIYLVLRTQGVVNRSPASSRIRGRASKAAASRAAQAVNACSDAMKEGLANRRGFQCLEALALARA